MGLWEVVLGVEICVCTIGGAEVDPDAGDVVEAVEAADVGGVPLETMGWALALAPVLTLPPGGPDEKLPPRPRA